MAQPTEVISTNLAGVIAGPIELPAGTTSIAVGIATVNGGTTLGSATFRVEWAIEAVPGDITTRRWFDAGRALDLDATSPIRTVPTFNYPGIRIALRAAVADADAQVGVWWGVPR